MNIATLIGLLFGLIVVTTAIQSATGDISIFWNPQGLAIVFGGVIASTFICYPLKDVMHLLSGCFKVLKREDLPAAYYLEEINYLSRQALNKSTMKLETLCKDIDNFFVQDGIRMIVDQYPTERFRQIMETTIDSTRSKGLAEAEIFRTMARLSPAFGMVGTLIGLIVMFQNLASDPSSVGINISVAMMSTFYGLIAANLIFTPIAIKMERHIEQREVLMNLLTEGLILISRRTPPEIIQDELKAFLPPEKWHRPCFPLAKVSTVKKASNKITDKRW